MVYGDSMRIGDLAEKSGISASTIRFYERNGLVHSKPGESKTNNYRHYPEENVEKLQFFTKAREAGMSVSELKTLMEAIGDGCDEDTGRRVVQERIDDLKERISQIKNVVSFLESQLSR